MVWTWASPSGREVGRGLTLMTGKQKGWAQAPVLKFIYFFTWVEPADSPFRARRQVSLSGVTCTLADTATKALRHLQPSILNKTSKRTTFLITAKS